ncbi:Beta-lactamase-like protein [Mycobacteroides abscessus subsp. abscessus]|uniref:MBL fold metallo-hydrolase n=1 Tax=Mycobacteroides abscessus TaxID=36809 RepID=UPI00092BB182|nr:MBL fold metallo-hydrolase [Mycobacteroides abscessus]SHT34497.1 Beta-lactamase-like protein [Mycobacteroides abscessus subsp. abscessus]SIK64266.1 Beta-lactamase-like protein [Mycobacteroides abscessus subsp. abscessus]SLE40958.1 Beta-lactamase-like protein [Mycobacteroides abscessus subsp. abscessus]SLE88803.1 Beta-lactamase-like protein [Mycobacteroides abscessus subsp. abscessus]SLF09682.1 Beta-lactamase-like protein [Mycobacteroides abscessus subsp. abscessus]
MPRHAVHTLGSATITQLSELDRWIVNPRKWFPAITDDQLALAGTKYPWSRNADPHHKLVSTLSNYVVQLGALVILVDTGIGNHKPRPGEPDMDMLHTDYPRLFTQAGFAPERVDLVINTHLHPDHCGWNTTWVKDQWLPTYPNARYLFHEVELTNIRSLAAPAKAPTNAMFANLYSDSVEPILQQAKWELVRPGDTIAELNGTTVTLASTPGHTPGHLAVEISDGQQTFLIIGDAFHQPFQLDYPDLPMFADADTSQAMLTRAELVRRCADEGARLLTAHFHTHEPVGIHRTTTGELRWTGLTHIAR